jgi:phage/plasmid-like protein (TIGR03299 family)
MSTTVKPSRSRGGSRSFYDGPGYTPAAIGDWVAITERDHPWNVLGHTLTGDGKQVADLMTAADVLAGTGLDLTVEKMPVYLADGTPVPKVHVTGYAADDGYQMFGAVSDRYEVVQPAEALAFFDQVVANVDGAHYSAAWNMREKSMMGVTIAMPEDEIVVDPNGANDRVGIHLLGVNSFDGSTGLQGAVVATRWFCMNQLTSSLRGAERRFTLRHTRNVRDRVEEAAHFIDGARDYIGALGDAAHNLYELPVGEDRFARILDRLPMFHPTKDMSVLVRERTEERRAEITEAWNAPHNANVTGTGWGVLNVVAEYTQWGRTVRGSARTGTDPVRQRAIGTLVSPHVTHPVDRTLELLGNLR